MPIPSRQIGESMSFPKLGISLAEKSRNALANFLTVLLPLGAIMLVAAVLLPADLFSHDIDFIPLHTILETFAIVVALQVFGTGWFGSGIKGKGRMVLLACVFLATGLLDLGHMLSYVGMPDFITVNNIHKGILFWLAARYVVAFGLVLMALTYGRESGFQTSRYLLVTLFILLVIALFWAILVYEKSLPATFVPGEGLTATKIWLEYGLVFLYSATAIWFFMLHEQQDSPIPRLIGYAAAVMAMSELCFTLYVSVADNFNVLGHIYKVLGYGILYRVLFISNVRAPYQRLEVANQRLREVSRVVSESYGTRLFDQLVEELSRQLGMRYVVILELDKESPGRGRVVALTGDDQLKLQRGQVYDLDSISCLNARQTGSCRTSCGAGKQCPSAILLRSMETESCLSTRLVDSKEQMIGVLTAFDSAPIHNSLPVEELMQIFAGRASAELERMRTDENLRSSEARMRSILTNIQDGIFRSDDQLRLEWASPSTEYITGYSPGELIGIPIEEFYSGREQYQAFLNQLEESGSVTGYEMQLKRKAGKLLWVSVNAHYYRDELGRILGVEGSVHDIQARKQAELELLALNQELEAKVEQRTRQLQESNEELEAFSYSVSHDLRAPLRHIGGFTSLLSSHCGSVLDAEGQDYIQRILRGVERMGQLIEDLLTLSQITQHELQRTELDISALVSDVVQQLSGEDPGQQVETLVESGLMVNADPMLVRIVLENLLSNAWKFTRREAHPRIEFGAYMESGRRVYFVKDNGAGFDMRYAGRLFSPFQRLHSTEEYEGTGIGLATVARIIRRHGGDIQANSVPGEGACFTFTL